MAYNGPIWYVDPTIGFNSDSNGTELQPIETIAYAIQRIGQVGFSSNGHTIRIKRIAGQQYGAIDATALNPTSTNRFVLTAWDTVTNGIPVVNGMIRIKDHMVVEGLHIQSADEGIQVANGATAIDDVLIRTNSFVLTGNGKAITIGGVNLDSVSNFRVIQNTIVKKGTGTNHGISITWKSSPNGILNSVVSNNIFYAVAYGIYSNQNINNFTNKGFVITHNCFYNMGSGDVYFSPAATNSVTSDPKFTNFPTDDFRLQDTSPCADAGTNIECSNFDLDGALRPIYKTWDIGAFEIQNPYLSQIVGGNAFEKQTGVTKSSIIKPSNLLALSTVSSNPNFDNENYWERILSVYKSTDGQKKIITHKKVGSTWQGQTAFSSHANVGAWQKREIIIIDKDGDGLSIGRSNFTDKEDLIIS